VEIKDLPGDHGRILYQPGLDALAAELTAALENADPVHAASAFRAGVMEPNTGRVSMEI